MDNDRYYQLGSYDKLFNQIDELTDALAKRDAEIVELKKHIDELNRYPVAWIRRHIKDDPNDNHLYIDTEKVEADRWVNQFKPGFAHLEPLFKHNNDRS